MRALLLIGVVAVLASMPAAAQRGGGRGRGAQTPAVNEPGFSCVANLQAPEFPKTALDRGIDGTVWATVQVSPQGTIDKIDTQVVSAWSEGSKLLAPPVEKAVRAATIKSDCAGKTVALAFRYVVAGDAIENPQVSSHIDSDRLMWIESQPPLRSAGTGHAASAKSEH